MVAAVALFAVAARAAPASNAEADITRVLREYLADTDDVAANERFWADDLIYTDAHGNRSGKKDVLEAVASAKSGRPSGKTFTHEARDIRVHRYGDTAVVALTLLAHITEAGKTTTIPHAITGVFHREAGSWRAVAWQSADLPPGP